MYRTIDCRRSNYWSGCFVKPTQNIKRFLKENIVGEKLAIKNYRKHIDEINDNKIIAVLERIILDEEKHIAIFNRLLEQFN